MRIVIKMLIVLALALVPVAASATHVIAIDPHSDCEGWSADVTVRFRTVCLTAEANYLVTLSDVDGNVLETQEWSGSFDRAMGSYQTQMYSFNGEWTVIAPPGDYLVEIYVSVRDVYQDDPRAMTRHDSFYCEVVPTETTSWSSLKSLYR